jgi:hypothetical protein
MSLHSLSSAEYYFGHINPQKREGKGKTAESLPGPWTRPFVHFQLSRYRIQQYPTRQTLTRTPLNTLHYVKTYIALPASFGPFLTNHQQLFWYHAIPRRLDRLIVLGFWALCIILACVDYQSFDGNIG